MKLSERKKGKLKLALTIGSVILSIMTLVAVCFGLNSMRTSTYTLQNSDYSVGMIANGVYTNSVDYGVATKDYYSIDGLEIEIEEDANVRVEIAMYNEDKEFLSYIDGTTTEDFATMEIAENATLFRVTIFADVDEDGNMPSYNVFTKSQLSNLVTITIDK